MTDKTHQRRLAVWSVLLLPFLGLLFLAGSGERASWPDLLPRESTILMQAESLIGDGDLRYTRLDFDRLLLGWRGNPPDLELATGGTGARITFQYPFPYAAYLAPFLALAPESGIAFANVLLLLVAAIWAGKVLERKLGFAGPLLVALWLFGSVVFTAVFRADGDVALLALAMAAATAWLEGHAKFAGLLLAPILLVAPWALLLPLLFVLGSEGVERKSLRPALLAGLGSGVLILVLVHWWNGGGLYFAANSTYTFTPATGYPAVDFEPTAWNDEVRKLSTRSWDHAVKWSWGIEPRLIFWNLVYLFVGGQLGLIPYFLPLLVFLIWQRPRPLLLVTLFYLGILLAAQPFNFSAGPGALGNRALLPLYGAAILFFPRLRDVLTSLAGRSLLIFSGVLVLAAPFLWTSWRQPAAWPYANSAFYHQTAMGKALVHEASQRYLPGGAIEELNGVWIAGLDEHTWVEKQPGFVGLEGKKASFLVCSGQELSALILELDENAPNEIIVRGGVQGDRMLRGDGGISFKVTPRLWRRHVLWFSPLPMYIYRIEVELPAGTQGDTRFRVLPEWQAGVGS